MFESHEKQFEKVILVECIQLSQEVLVLNLCQYQRLEIRKVQIPVRNSFLIRFRKKGNFKVARVSTSSRTAFRKGKKKLKIRGLKVESDSEINPIPAIKGKVGLFELTDFCQTVCSAFTAGMGRQRFLFFARWYIIGIFKT